MKCFFKISLVALLLTAIQGYAQVPQGINYQGVARGLDGQPLAQKDISIRISILNQSASGPVEYEEVHDVKTNAFGLFTLVIGQGTSGSNDFSFIGWTSGQKWLQVELDENGGRNFKLMGSQQLMSVPYALYAERSGNGYQAGQGISINNNMISNAGDGDHDSTNELINSVTLGTDNKLRITDAGGTKETDLSSLLGASQNLSNVLTEGNSAANTRITNLGTPLSAADAATKAYVDAHVDGDASATNEIQNLAEVLGQGSDAGGSKITNLGDPILAADAATKAYVDAHADGDSSPTNEIQDLSLAGNTLSLSGDATTVNLAPYLDNTDNQNLSAVLGIGNNASGLKIENLGTPLANTDAATKAYVDAHTDGDASATNELQSLSSSAAGTNRTINISGGSGTTIDVADNDNNPTNESQTLSRSGSNVTLTQVSGIGGGVVSIDDADSNPTNEAQTLTKSGTTVSLTSVSGAGGGSFVINDDSNTNEAQSIARVGSTVTLTPANGAGGGTFSIDDADANATNEAQSISRVGSTVTMTPVGVTGGGSFSVNDNDADPANEIQNLSTVVSGTSRTINISGGIGATIDVADNDNSATNELQNLDQVLTVNNSAGTKAITNLADPTNAQDAATKKYVDDADAVLSSKISTTYAFKALYNFTHTAPTSQIVALSIDFDDFSVISSNRFTAPENGIYQFTASGGCNATSIQMQIRVTPISGPAQFYSIKRQTGYPDVSTLNYFDSTILKLIAGDQVDLIVTSGLTGEIIIGSFFGFKL